MLSNVTVLGLEQAVAAPLATRLLRLGGARVIKIERPDGIGDLARAYDTFAQGSSSYFAWLNAGKESLVADLKQRKDVELIQNIVVRAAKKGPVVAVSNLAPGATKKLGLDPDALCRLAPERVVAVNISGYGSNDSRKAYDLTVAAEAGLCAITGSDGGGPGRPGVSIVDIMTGRQAYAAALEGILRVERGLGGGIAEISMFDAVAEMMTVPLLQFRATGEAPKRLGLRHPSIAPYGAFSTRDGRLVLVSVQSDREWRRLCAGLGGSLSGCEERFPTAVSRIAERAQVDEVVSKAFSMLTWAEAGTALREADVAYALVSEVADLSIHPRLREQVVQNEKNVNVSLPDEPVVWMNAKKKNASPLRVPKLGEHSTLIRKEFL